MPRLFSNDINELKIYDNLSGSTIVLFYRDPTTAERMAYANESVVRKRNRIITRLPETRIKFGEMILTGFKEGGFVVRKNGQDIPMSSDPASPNYTQDWKDQIVNKASDLVMLLAARVFDAPAETAEAEPEDDEEDAEKN